MSILSNGARLRHSRRVADRSVEQVAAGWQIKKRDGRTEPFSVAKVRNVLARCLVQALEWEPAEAAPVIDRVATRVVNLLAAQNKTEPTVEEVQEAVIHQLWSDGQYEAATHYTLYRENRRKAREERPIPADVIARIEADVKHFPTQIQAYQFYSKFSRWREQDKRRETWSECNARVFDWFGTLPAFHKLRTDEVDFIKQMMFDFKASPAMRVVQMAGPALERCHVGAYNCAAHPIVDLFAFAELLYILMQGSGNGFSVESDFISRLPRVKKQKKRRKVVQHAIPDNTEGWCDALHFGLKTWFAGGDVEFDYSLIRKKGTKLKTKGGRASGPEPLKELLTFVREVVLGSQGRRLTDLEVHDVCCMIGRIVQVGGVRRAACISLSDIGSVAMRECKHGEWWNVAKQRSMANNSAVYDYDELPPIEVFMEEWLALVKAKSGERGIFNRAAARKCRPSRRKRSRFICNPCAEIILRPFQFCNLSIAVLRGHETKEEMAAKVRAATMFGVLQSTATDFQYIRPEWKKNCEEERLLGVDIMGHLDHPLLRPGAEGRAELVQYLKQVVADTAKELSERFGIAYSAANTCLKPGGDSGVFFHSCTLGGYASEYQIRTTREAMTSPVTAMLRDQGLPVETDVVNPELAVISWPRKNPAGCVTEGSMGAIEQLENWLFWKKNWAEHSCSTTIHVKPHEWLAVGAWIYQKEHFEHLTGVCFMPFDDHSYVQAPNQRITQEQYEKLSGEMPVIDWSKLMRYEHEDMTESSMTPACTSGSCER